MQVTLNDVDFNKYYIVSGTVLRGSRRFPFTTMGKIEAYGSSFVLTNNGYMFINDSDLTIDGEPF